MATQPAPVNPLLVISGAAGAGTIFTIGATLLGNDPETAEHNQIMQWTAMIASNPAAALLPPSNTGSSISSIANAWLWLRCWGRDQSVIPVYVAASGDRAVLSGNGCGAGSWQFAQSMIAGLKAQFPILTGAPAPVTGGAPSESPLPGTNTPTPQTTLPLTGTSSSASTSLVPSVLTVPAVLAAPIASVTSATGLSATTLLVFAGIVLLVFFFARKKG